MIFLFFFRPDRRQVDEFDSNRPARNFAAVVVIFCVSVFDSEGKASARLSCNVYIAILDFFLISALASSTEAIAAEENSCYNSEMEIELSRR